MRSGVAPLAGTRRDDTTHRRPGIPARGPGRLLRRLMADLEDLLVKTSRTFALSIPQLEGGTRDQVTLGYLLLRIADTLEDAAVWSREQRVEALFRFADLLKDPNERADGAAEGLVASWLAEPPSPHEGYLELLEATDEVLAAYRALDPPARSSARC